MKRCGPVFDIKSVCYTYKAKRKLLYERYVRVLVEATFFVNDSDKLAC
jgi:hypothetical protein